MNKELYYKLKWALELAKPKDNCINYNQYAKDVLALMEEEDDIHSLERTDIKRSEPPLGQGENPCVNISKQHKELMDKDYAKEDGDVK